MVRLPFALPKFAEKAETIPTGKLKLAGMNLCGEKFFSQYSKK